MERDLTSSNIFNAGKNRPQERRVVGEGGRVVVEKVTNMPYQKMVDLDGNVRRVPLANGSGLHPNNPTANATLHKLNSKGFIRYDRCAFFDAQSRVWIPREMMAKGPSAYGCDGTGGSVKQACRCVEEIISMRKQQNAKFWVEYEEQRKTFEQRQYEDEQKRNKDMLSHLAKFAEAQQSLTAPKPNYEQPEPEAADGYDDEGDVE